MEIKQRKYPSTPEIPALTAQFSKTRDIINSSFVISGRDSILNLTSFSITKTNQDSISYNMETSV